MRQRIIKVLLVALLASEGFLLYQYVEVSNELEQMRALLHIVLGPPVQS